MTYRFRCTILKQKFDKPRNMPLLDGRMAQAVTYVTDGRVYQINRDGTQSVVALLQHTASMDTEDMWTKILCSDGCLTHHEYFDAPVFPRREYHLPGNRGGFALNHSSGKSEIYLIGREEERCQVVCDANETGKGFAGKTVYRPGQEGKEPLARIVCTAEGEGWEEYEIQLFAATSNLLCVAVCSLAFSG